MLNGYKKPKTSLLNPQSSFQRIQMPRIDASCKYASTQAETILLWRSTLDSEKILLSIAAQVVNLNQRQVDFLLWKDVSNTENIVKSINNAIDDARLGVFQLINDHGVYVFKYTKPWVRNIK